MNIFRLVKDILTFRKNKKEQQEQQAIFLLMPTSSLSNLSDDELFRAALARTEHIVDSSEDMETGFRSLNDAQSVLYALNYMEMEINNGGLCQFFVNPSRMVAPFVSEYMAVIGASDHKELFDQFISKHNIDLQNLSSFQIEKIAEYQLQYDRYPFDEYDSAFYELEPIEAKLIPFVRSHVDKF